MILFVLKIIIGWKQMIHEKQMIHFIQHTNQDKISG